jgi:DNA-binding NtrC family response regulator
MASTLERPFPSSIDLAGVLEDGPALDGVRSMAMCAAAVDASLMISGARAAWRVSLARLIHEASDRASRRFTTVRCDGTPDSLLESKLFGRVRGGSSADQTEERGLLEAADGGTLFLDEIGKAGPSILARLFRFLETGHVHRVGGESSTARVNVRLITGTDDDLQDDVASGSFSSDLFYRLNVIHIALPPLGLRRGSAQVLAEKRLDRPAPARGLHAL